MLDEPTPGANPAETLELAGRIKSLNRQGLTMLLIEQKLDVGATPADKVVVLDHGEKIAEGPPDAVRRDEEVISAYLGRRRSCRAGDASAGGESTKIVFRHKTTYRER